MNDKEIKLPAEDEKAFNKNFMIGILKGLYIKNLLTDSQLDRLVLMQN
jgi:hypothetical protein